MTASGARKMMPMSKAARSHTIKRPERDQTSMRSASEPSRREPIERKEAERERDIDQGDGAGALIVGLLDRLVIDQERQRDDAFGADEQHDPELVDGKEQAEAAAGDRGRKGSGQNDAAHD